MRKVVSFTMAVVLVLGMFASTISAQASSTVKLYAPDGRTAKVAASEVDAYVKVGWYTEPVIKIYSPDGRTKIIKKTELEARKKLGWYETKEIKMYASDGRTIKVAVTQIAAYKAVGWSTEPYVTLYAADGRTKVVKQSEVEARKKMGWSEQPVTKTPTTASSTFYTGTVIPKYDVYGFGTYVDKNTSLTDDGDTAYFYTYKSTQDNKQAYVDFLMSIGWNFYDGKVEDDHSAWYLTKDGQLVAVYFYYANNKVRIGYIVD